MVRAGEGQSVEKCAEDGGGENDKEVGNFT